MLIEGERLVWQIEVSFITVVRRIKWIQNFTYHRITFFTLIAINLLRMKLRGFLNAIRNEGCVHKELLRLGLYSKEKRGWKILKRTRERGWKKWPWYGKQNGNRNVIYRNEEKALRGWARTLLYINKAVRWKNTIRKRGSLKPLHRVGHYRNYRKYLRWAAGSINEIFCLLSHIA